MSHRKGYIMPSVPLPVEILDRIFGFLASERNLTIVNCSKHPALSPFVERHLYYHLTVDTRRKGRRAGTFDPLYLANRISDNPQIPYYVRILEIILKFHDDQKNAILRTTNLLSEFAKILVMFPTLESIMLTDISFLFGWKFPAVFRIALEDCLSLPTLKELHVDGGRFPISLLNNCKNISHLSLQGSLDPTSQNAEFALLPLKSLSLGAYISVGCLKRHIKQLWSLKYKVGYLDTLLKLLEGCRRTLNKLEVNLTTEQYAFIPSYANIVEVPNLHRLIIRTTLHPHWCSPFPASAAVIYLLTSSPRHLMFDINIRIPLHELSQIDISPLEVLGADFLSTRRTDLYVHGFVFAQAQFLSSLEKYEDINKAIEQGRLFVHMGATAPEL